MTTQTKSIKLPDKRSSHVPRVRSLITFTVLIVLLFGLIVGYQALFTYRQAVTNGKDTSVRLARILADHVELTFLGVDLSLRRAIEREYFNALFGNNLPEYTEHNFKVWLNETPQIAALAQIDEFGVVQVAAHKRGYAGWLDYHQTIVGKKLFSRLKEAADTQVFIGRHDTKNDGSLIIMSRRYNKLDGEFGGIVVAAINPNYFIDFYSSIADGEHKFMSLMLPDGSPLAMGPFDNPDYHGLSVSWLNEQQQLGEQVETRASSGGNTTNIVSIRRLKNMPIVVSVVLEAQGFMDKWHQDRMRDVGFLGIFTVFGTILSWMAIAMARQTMRAEESEASAILASQAKSEFLANMSHELRTPLNAIIGFSEMINSGYFGPLNAKQKERIHDINLCGSHLLQLITDILEFSKGDAGRLELVEEKFDMASTINECVRIMNGKIKGKHIKLVVAVDPDLPMIWGDKRKLRQVLINLISNSIKFTPDDGTVTISAKVDSHRDLVLTVADTGIGIPEGDIAKALSVFGQVHRNKSHEGTGLGLPLCKMYAELHGGSLKLTSKLGEGTTVYVTLPYQRLLRPEAAGG
ncbi:MAG: sensor histidine kinase [Alphaproteobacteria bacterium]